MLAELRVRNLAIAADVTVRLGPGLNVLTGSTGAGKSLVVEALRWLSGGRVDRSLVRSGEEEASAEALFDLQARPDLLARLAELGLDPPEDAMLRLRREVRVGGRSRSFVGTQLSTAGVLAAACRELVELQSQHQQVALLQPAEHVRVLDACGVGSAALEEYRGLRRAYLERRQAVQTWRERQRQLSEQRDLAEYQLRELERAHLQGEEMDPLRERVAVLSGGVQLMEKAATAREALADERAGVRSGLQRALSRLRVLGDEIHALAEARDALTAAGDLVDEAERSLDAFLADEDFDPAALAGAQARLAELEELCRKYGRTEGELVRLRDRLAQELGELEMGDGLPPHLAHPLEEARLRLQKAAADLHERRKRVARRVAREAAALLATLAMPDAAVRFELPLRVEPDGDLLVEGRRVQAGPGGCEDVELHVRTNRGEAFERIDRIASGGELSRLGLVLRTLSLAERSPAVLILDEVDTGLGADTGPALAQRLVAMAHDTQLLVITHLPAVAAVADHHLAATKAARAGRTLGRVDGLDREGRVRELARMLGGSGDSHRRLARKLLDSVGRRREGRAG